MLSSYARTAAVAVVPILFLCVFFSVAVQASASVHIAHSNTVALSNGLVGYWAFDGGTLHWNTGTVDDVSGNGNTGQLISMNTTTSPVIGKIGQALQFSGNGPNGYIKGPDVSSLLANSLSISFWEKEAAHNNNNRPVTTYQGAGSNVIGFLSNSSLGAFSFEDFAVGGTILELAGSQGFNPGTAWHHIVGTRDSATGVINLYRDGRLASTTVGSTGSLSHPQNKTLQIGGSGLVGNSYVNGAIDDVRIYNRALSAQEVQQLYAQGAAHIAHSNTVALSNGLVAYWTFDGNTTNWTTGKALDSSGNGNTGQLIKMSTSTSPVAGKIGGALKFDGVSSQVTFSGLTTGTTWTYAAWVKPDASQSASNGDLITQDNAFGVTYRGTAAGGNSGRVSFYCSGCAVNSNSTLKNGAWNFVVVTIGGGNFTIYINGKFDSTVAGGSSMTLDSMGNDIQSEAFKGQIDDARLYNRALSYQEIQELYLMGRVRI